MSRIVSELHYSPPSREAADELVERVRAEVDHCKNARTWALTATTAGCHFADGGERPYLPTWLTRRLALRCNPETLALTSTVQPGGRDTVHLLIQISAEGE